MQTPALILALALSDFRHVTFEGRAPTIYKETDGAIVATVASSASFLLQAFPAPRTVTKVRVVWQAEGRPRVRDAAHEASKDGDDAVLRVGLLLRGEAPLIPFFAPAWIKAVRDTLKHPTGEMLYLVLDARHKAGETWESPYASDIRNMSIAGSDVVLAKPLQVVGLWLMADGDDTKSSFTVTVKELNVE